MSVSSNHKEQHFPIVVKTMQGFEDILAEEMRGLDVKDVEILKRAVKGEATLSSIYKVNYQSYFALRVLATIHSAKISNLNRLYQEVQRIDWSEYLQMDQTFAIHSTVYSELFTHSHFVSLKTKDAIADQFMDKFDKRPNVDTKSPDIIIHIHIALDQLNISLDSSGESLHKRGYKIQNVRAPINEVLAAGLIKLSEWDYEKTLWDPMCGSGTFLTEALLQAFHIPPQLKERAFPFKNWPNYDEELWDKITTEADSKMDIRDSVQVRGTDIRRDCINATKYNIAELGLLEHANLEEMNFLDFKNDGETYHIIMNPPYDERLPLEDAIETYNNIGSVFKHQLHGSEAWVISANITALKRIGLRPSKKITVFNGPLESKFHKFIMYEGSRKK